MYQISVTHVPRYLQHLYVCLGTSTFAPLPPKLSPQPASSPNSLSPSKTVPPNPPRRNESFSDWVRSENYHLQKRGHVYRVNDNPPGGAARKAVRFNEATNENNYSEDPCGAPAGARPVVRYSENGHSVPGSSQRQPNHAYVTYTPPPPWPQGDVYTSLQNHNTDGSLV